MQADTKMKARGGRDASRERRARLVQGKTALPPAAERVRTGLRSAAIVDTPSPMPAHAASAATPLRDVIAPAPAVPAPTAARAPMTGEALQGRELSKARRAGQVQGKAGLRQPVSVPPGAAHFAPPAEAGNEAAPVVTAQTSARAIAQAVRAARARNGGDPATPTRPSGRVRAPTPISYPPKVAETETYAGRKVTGVRIGRGMNVTGDEPGADLQVTGSQYIGTETGFAPRATGTKVGASRTAGGLVVTGSQVRSKIQITGDESNGAIRITGEADQEIGDDLLGEREQGAYASMQFQRQNNPHGHTVFGTNLGRSIKSIGSRDRDRTRTTETTDGGMQISGTAVGRSVRVTGDEPGSCHTVTGDQYLMPAARQPLCDAPPTVAAARRARRAGAMADAAGQERSDPVTGAKVTVSESWGRQRITGVDVEHNANVSGDEYGACASVTGTPYAGPGQYDVHCATDRSADAAHRMMPGFKTSAAVTGDTPLNVEHVTGTQRGGDRDITGTRYFTAEVEAQAQGDVIDGINRRFSVRSPQREAHLHAHTRVAQAPGSGSRITGSFAVGEGKITGNQEFGFSTRGAAERDDAKSRITGEGRLEGPAITGSAWDVHAHVTGTEGHIAAERNPSERAGKPHGFANSTLFKNEGKHEPARQIVTGMVGWSAKSAAKVTLSGGAQG